METETEGHKERQRARGADSLNRKRVDLLEKRETEAKGERQGEFMPVKYFN